MLDEYQIIISADPQNNPEGSYHLPLRNEEKCVREMKALTSCAKQRELSGSGILECLALFFLAWQVIRERLENTCILSHKETPTHGTHMEGGSLF